MDKPDPAGDRLHPLAWLGDEADGRPERDTDGRSSCRQGSGINVDHMEIVTGRVNTLRGDSPHAKAARQTACIWGHPFDAANTYTRGGRRSCRACNANAVH